MEASDFFHDLQIPLMGFTLSKSLMTSLLITLLLTLGLFVLKRRLKAVPGGLQVVMEAVYLSAYQAVESMVGEQASRVLGFILGLWVFILSANLIGLIPGFAAPTADLSVTFALAVCVFLAVHWFGIRTDGLASYLRHYLQPNPLLLPFHIISELSRTLALAVRLFGNVMSLEMAAYLILLVAGFLVPVPLLMLHIVEAVLQAYLFGVLALIYIAGGMESHRLRKRRTQSYE